MGIGRHREMINLDANEPKEHPYHATNFLRFCKKHSWFTVNIAVEHTFKTRVLKFANPDFKVVN